MKIQNILPGTQSIFIPNKGTAQEYVISSEQDIRRIVTRGDKTTALVVLNNLW